MTGETPLPKRRGRPPKSAGDRKGGNLTFRVRHGMREELEVSARARGLSISEEIERRLGFAFDIAPNPETEIIVRSISSAVKLAEIATGKKWSKDKSTAIMASSAISKAGTVVLAPHMRSNLNPDLVKKAMKAGEALGLRSIAGYFELPQEKIREIGSEEVLRFQFSQMGVPDDELNEVISIYERRRKQGEERGSKKPVSLVDMMMPEKSEYDAKSVLTQKKVSRRPDPAARRQRDTSD